MPALILYLAFNLVWLACALGAAQGYNSVGVCAALLFVVGHLWSRNWSRGEWLLIVAAGLAGAIAESVLGLAGVVHHNAAFAGGAVAPPWIIALWFAFGATITSSARALGAHAIVKAALLGALFGPLAYVAGARLGALTVGGPPWIAYAALSVVWAVAFPLLILLDRCLARRQDAGTAWPRS